MERESEFTKILRWPGYRVYRYEIDERGPKLRLWVRRKRGNRKLECSGCGRKFAEAYDARERAVRDLPWGVFQTSVYIEVYRVKCPDCGVKVEKVPLLPGKAPCSERFEDAVGVACQSAAIRQVARQHGLSKSTVRAMDKRFLARWHSRRRVPALRQMGIDEIYLGKKTGFLTVVSNLETAEPLWFGRERKKETLDEYFRTQLSLRQRRAIQAACVDMWAAWKQSLTQWAPQCRIIYDKFHIIGHANTAIDEVRRAEFVRQGGWKRELVKGKRWLLLARWITLETENKRLLNQLFNANRRMWKAYLLKESLGQLWNYVYEGAMLNYLQKWIDQLRWQRLEPFQKLGQMLLEHLDGILNYCRIKVPMGVVEAVNGNIKALIRRGRGYKDLDYLLLKARYMAATKSESIVLEKAA